MDYKYIEQLLQRYWDSQTSLEEEAILRSFFSQKDIPTDLLPYSYLFQAEEDIKNEARLDNDFDNRVLNAIGERQQSVRAVRICITSRLRPFFRAAAVIAIFLTIGIAVQHSWKQPDTEMATVEQQPGDSTSIEIVDEATAETSLAADTTLSMPLKD